MPSGLRAGQMRHQLTIQQDTGTQSTSGEVTPNWTTYSAWWAEIVPLSGGEAIAARENYGTVTHRLTGRWLSGVTPKMRAILGSRVFQIDAVLNIGERNRELRIFCTEAV